MSGRRARGAVAAVLLLVAGCSGAAEHSAPGGGTRGAASSQAAPAPSRSATAGPGAAATTTGVPSTRPSPSKDPAAARWQPRPGVGWQWQLSGTVDTSVDVPVYDIDGFENSAGVVAGLHRAGRKVICYVNAGAYESFRPDAARYPKALLGRGDGWDGERWLDIRRLGRLRPLLAARFDMCRTKGFDAVEPDLLDGYANDTGFPLTAGQQLAFNRMVAELAHQRGLAVGLKNDLDQVPALVGDFDFSVDEQCAQYEECDALTPFIAAGKAVFHAEYELTPSQFCPQGRRLRLSSIRKHLSLDAWREAC